MKQNLALLPTHDVVAVPGLLIPLLIPIGPNLEALEYALEHSDRQLVLALQTGPGEPSKKNINTIGAFAQVVQSISLSTGEKRIRLHVGARAQITEFLKFKPFVLVETDEVEAPSDIELDSEAQSLIDRAKVHLELLGEYDPEAEEHGIASLEVFDPGELADLISAALPLELEDAKYILEEFDPLKRLEFVSEKLQRRLELLSFRKRLVFKHGLDAAKQAEEEVLREQIRRLQGELGESHDPELQAIEEQISSSKMPKVAKSAAEKQIRRLKTLHPDTSEAALARTYLDWIIGLPWAKRTKDQIDLSRAKKILDADHFGLDKPKERILDFLGVRKLRKSHRGPILLFVGPPGVGKTSLGKSIAKAMGRKFIRLSLGGLRDEAELRGHRRTYVGALPGRIIQGLKTAGTKNPVFVLDEIDKIGSDVRGDPASVLLEILDPEQNGSFEDHYLNLPFDISEVMFIGTANVTDLIPAPLLDRMEVIDIAGYMLEEKIQIARRYLEPRSKEDSGLGDSAVTLSDNALSKLISAYTKESGVRSLGREMSTVFRKIARRVAEGGEAPEIIEEQRLEDLLGVAKYVPDPRQKTDEIGVASGLAWTPTGGEILPIEVAKTLGKGTLSLTGQQGKVMQESAKTALTYLLSKAEEFGFDPRVAENANIHVHLPQGAIPKDGPSAGVAIAIALASLLTGRRVSCNVAMTGEITLRGTILAIGGLREKSLAALRAGISTVIFPKENERELTEFPAHLLKEVEFISCEDVIEVIERALLPLEATAPISTGKPEPIKLGH